MALAVLMHSKWTMASDHVHKAAADFGPGKRTHGAGPIPVPLKYRSKHAYLHAPASVSPPGGRHHHHHSQTHHSRHSRHSHAHGRGYRMDVSDDPVRDGMRLAYDADARLPSDRRDNMVTMGGDLSEGIRQWDCESDIRLGDIVHDGEAEPAYTVAFQEESSSSAAAAAGTGPGPHRRRGGRQRRKGGAVGLASGGGSGVGSAGFDDLADDFDVMDDGWQSDDDAAISLADGWAEMESWRDMTSRAEPALH